MQFHPEGVDISPAAMSRLEWLAALRVSLNGPLAVENRRLAEAASAGGGVTCDAIRVAIEREPFHQLWSATLRASQDLMWHHIGEEVDRDSQRLQTRLQLRRQNAVGTLTTNADLPLPEYLREADTHRMPGSFFADRGDLDVRAGAVYDVGGAIYQLGIGNRSGLLLNDSRGRTVLSYLRHAHPDLRPRRILDLGCGVGHNTIPLAEEYPDARVTAVDIGAAMVRYGHLRAEGIGVPVDFIQANAEQTDLPDGAFDIVVSQIVLHETSPEAAVRILRESVRVTRPGGVVVHLEVPFRRAALNEAGRVLATWEQWHNAEGNLSWTVDADFKALLADAGCADVREGFQPIPPPGETQGSELLAERPARGSWYLVSGVRSDVR